MTHSDFVTQTCLDVKEFLWGKRDATGTRVLLVFDYFAAMSGAILPA